MKCWMRVGVLVWAGSVVLGAVEAGMLSDFDDLSLAPQSYWNGQDGSGGFVSGAGHFNNGFTDWGGGITSWEGFAYSNRTDVQTSGLDGQYTAMTGGAQSGSNYAVGFVGFSLTPVITFSEPTIVQGMSVTNTNYAYYTLRDGDPLFGIDPFSEGDWFVLTITGKDAAGQVVGAVETALADFRDGRNELLDAWRYVDLSGLGAVQSLEFTLASSDVGPWGMNTPAYFAIDSIVPEPATLVLLSVGGLILRRRVR
ncbi:MAG: DUF4465 domain-containing protein [Sedimentisphaerales bacterium]|nr:DUF4465 domain-containing protein [Sedimentisphaerales bacterium]